ncbi:unnamed protein product [Durusdinium trenchii]|uniref:Uncharacterized protein n=1 Tax=Durusdinium trenchii TaxID=1381693 RepID=A0ABP0LXM0_9DINO
MCRSLITQTVKKSTKSYGCALRNIGKAAGFVAIGCLRRVRPCVLRRSMEHCTMKAISRSKSDSNSKLSEEVQDWTHWQRPKPDPKHEIPKNARGPSGFSG